MRFMFRLSKKMNKVFLSGASGMVGRNILEHPNANNYEWITPSSQELDLTQSHQVIEFFTEYRPDIVIHCAGLVGGIQANIQHPTDFFLKNLRMGMNIVDAAHQVGVSKLINLGSSCMYPRNLDRPINEGDMLAGTLEPTNEGYALAKIAVAKLMSYIRREFPERHYVTFVPCNLYGRFDKFDPKHSHMIPAVIHKIYRAKLNGLDNVEIWGDGSARREFMYCSDLADFVFQGIEQIDRCPEMINVGLGRDYTVLEYYQAVARVLEYTGEFEFDLSKPVGMTRKLVSNNLALKMGWGANTSLLDGIRRTYEYYLKEVVNA